MRSPATLSPESATYNRKQSHVRCRLGATAQSSVLQSVPLAFEPFSQPTTPVRLCRSTSVEPRRQTGMRQRRGRRPIGMRGHVASSSRPMAPERRPNRGRLFLTSPMQSSRDGYKYEHREDGPHSETLYMAECRKRGVPIPPDWNKNTNRLGASRKSERRRAESLQPGIDATFGLHRSGRCGAVSVATGSGGSPRRPCGVICQGAANGNACFGTAENGIT